MIHTLLTNSNETNLINTLNSSIIYNETYNDPIWSNDAVCSSDDANSFLTSRVFQSFIYIMYTGVFMFALIGNFLVCYVVLSSPRMKTVTNYFIMNLAIGDILMTLFCVPFSFVSMLVLRYWPFGMAMCKIVNYTQAVSVFVSAYTLLAISIDRYIVIMRPLRPRLGKTAAKLVIASVWAGALATAAPIFLVSQIEKPTDWHQLCKLDICLEHWDQVEQSKQYTIALMILQFGLPLSVLVYTYIRIAHVVWGGRPPGEAESTRDHRIRQSKRKMVKMMVTVVIVFVVSWLPLNLFIVFWTVNEHNEEWAMWPGMPYAWFICHWMAMSHCCYNPIIYCYMNSKFRRGYKQALGCFIESRVERSSRMCQRSSLILCEGLPLSDIPCGSGMCRRGTGTTSFSRAQLHETSTSVRSHRQDRASRCSTTFAAASIRPTF